MNCTRTEKMSNISHFLILHLFNVMLIGYFYLLYFIRFYGSIATVTIPYWSRLRDLKERYTHLSLLKVLYLSYLQFFKILFRYWLVIYYTRTLNVWKIISRQTHCSVGSTGTLNHTYSIFQLYVPNFNNNNNMFICPAVYIKTNKMTKL